MSYLKTTKRPQPVLFHKLVTPSICLSYAITDRSSHFPFYYNLYSKMTAPPAHVNIFKEAGLTGLSLKPNSYIGRIQQPKRLVT